MQGIVSIQVLATPMIGFARSSSVKPMAFSMARAPRAVASLGDGVAVEFHGRIQVYMSGWARIQRVARFSRRDFTNYGFFADFSSLMVRSRP